KLDLDRSLRRADARPDHLALLAVDLAVAQVADASGAKLADAGVADALAAAVRQVESGFLAGDEDRHMSVRLRLAIRAQELDGPAFSLAALAEPELRLEALHVEALEVRVGLPVLAERVQHLGRA